MEVYRITLNKWANTLHPSGYAGRWNSNGVFVLYTSSSIALASLENIVHRSGEGLNRNFQSIEIHVPNDLIIEEIKLESLPMNWYEFKNYGITQVLGDQWINRCTSPILKVPSAIIKKEANFLINPAHLDFSKIRISTIEDFDFDPRLKK